MHSEKKRIYILVFTLIFVFSLVVFVIFKGNDKNVVTQKVEQVSNEVGDLQTPIKSTPCPDCNGNKVFADSSGICPPCPEVVKCPDCNGKKVSPDANGNCPECEVVSEQPTIPPDPETSKSSKESSPLTRERELTVDLNVDWKTGMVSWNPELSDLATSLILVVTFPDMEFKKNRFEKSVIGRSKCLVNVNPEYVLKNTTVKLEVKMPKSLKIIDGESMIQSQKNGILDCTKLSDFQICVPVCDN